MKKIAIIFSKHSEALFNLKSNRALGGGEIQMFLLAKNLQQMSPFGVTSLIQDFDVSEFPDKSQFNLQKTYKETDNLLTKIYKFHRAIQQVRPDILIQRGLTPLSYFLSLYSKLFGIKFVLMFGHDIEAEGLYQTSRKRCFNFEGLIKNSSKIVVQNAIQKNLLPWNKNNVVIQKKGLDISKVKKSNLKIYDAVWVGRCAPWKHPELFLELAKSNPGYKFLMIWAKTELDTDYYLEIKEKVKAISNIAYFENMPNDTIYEYLAKSKVYCFTSDKEGDWPMVVLEAAASGLPILSYSLNYDYLIDDYKAGYYSASDFALFDSQFKKLQSDHMLFLQTSTNALKYIDEKHTINSITNDFIETLKSI
jgi:glycosyltransferase involved in cell wall biosynthesis